MRALRNHDLLRLRAGWRCPPRPGGSRTRGYRTAGAKKLSEIIKLSRTRGYAAITEVNFEDGAWKIEAHQPTGARSTFGRYDDRQIRAPKYPETMTP